MFIDDLCRMPTIAFCVTRRQIVFYEFDWCLQSHFVFDYRSSNTIGPFESHFGKLFENSYAALSSFAVFMPTIVFVAPDV